MTNRAVFNAALRLRTAQRELAKADRALTRKLVDARDSGASLSDLSAVLTDAGLRGWSRTTIHNVTTRKGE